MIDKLINAILNQPKNNQTSSTTFKLPETFILPPYVLVTPLFTHLNPGESITDKDIEHVVKELNCNNHILSSQIINTLGRIISYLTQVSHPTTKNLV